MSDESEKPLVSIISESTVGGVARQLELIAEEMPARGIALHMIVSCDRDPAYLATIERFRAAGIAVDVVPMVRGPSPWADWKALGRIRDVLRSKKPHLVHTHVSKAGILGRRAAASLGIPAVHTPHVFAFEWATGFRRRIYLGLERMAARWCDGIVALSEEQRDTIVANGISRLETTHVIPNGVSCEAFRPASDDERVAARRRFGMNDDHRVVGVAGRLEPQKGLGNLLRAVAKIRQANPKVRVLIAGTGTMESDCKRRAAELGIDEIVIFCGDVDDMPTFYHGLDCFMLASLWEGLPYVVLEAMACRLPVVTTQSFDYGGLVRDGETGIAVKLDDVDGLAAAAGRVLDDRTLADGLGHAAREIVEADFSVSHWADALATLYRNLANFTAPGG